MEIKPKDQHRTDIEARALSIGWGVLLSLIVRDIARNPHVLNCFALALLALAAMITVLKES